MGTMLGTTPDYPITVRLAIVWRERRPCRRRAVRGSEAGAVCSSLLAGSSVSATVVRPRAGARASERGPARSADAQVEAANRPARRDLALDGLRGLAALSVVIHHAVLALPWSGAAIYDPAGRWSSIPGIGPLNVVWAGHEAVLLFFVLSAFVLVVRYGVARRREYWAYVAQRVPRLYVPYAVAVGLSCALLTLWHPPRAAGVSAWFGAMWSDPVTPSMLFDLAVMQAGAAHNVDTSTWSLGVEMRFSLLLPLFAAAAVRLPLWRGIAGAVVLAGAVHFATARWAWTSSGLYYAPVFLAGAILATHRDRVTADAARLSRAAAAALLVVALVCYTWRWEITAWWPYVARAVAGGAHRGSPPRLLVATLADVVPVIGSMGLIVLAIGNGLVRHTLERPWAEWLGRISFSLYLVHPLVLLTVVHGLNGLVSPTAAVVLAVLASFPAAVVAYHAIELPSHRLARAAGRWAARRVTP